MRGFVTFELLVGLSVIALLVVALMPIARGLIEKARAMNVLQQLQALTTATTLYEQDVGSFPSNADALYSDPGVGGWNGPYLTVRIKNPWKGEITFDTSSGFKVSYTSVPESAAKIIDERRDDGDLSTGNVTFSNGTLTVLLIP